MKRWGILVACLVLSFLIASAGLVGAEGSQNWFSDSQAPVITLAEESATPPERDYWGADCRELSYEASWIDSLGKQINQTVNNCVHQASYGYIGTYGVRLRGTKISYSMKSKTGGSISIYPIPGSKDALTFSQTSSTSYKYLYIYKNLPGNIEATKNSDDSTKYYKLTKAHDSAENIVKFKDGTPAIVQDQTPVYSLNGRYIFANSGRAQTLVDTQANTARVIGKNTNRSSGAPRVSLAINSDASIAFVANNSNGSYNFYNTTDCSANINPSNPELCQSKDISSLVQRQIPNIRSILKAKFLGDQKLELYISRDVNGSTKTSRYIVYQPGYQESDFAYLGLGDSFASGEGAFDYTNITNNDNNRCHISRNSYPKLIKASLAFEESESVACSGGKIKDIHKIKEDYVNDSPQASGKIEEQYDNEIFTGFLPGYRRQWEFVSKYQPEAVTLSIGGNDINFGKKLQYCILTQYSCFESAEQKNGILKELKAQFPNLVKTYTDLKEASPNTRIYVVGYPKLVQPGGDCALNVHLSSSELLLADEIVEDLNFVVKRAAQSAGVFYVDTSNAFVGHKLCEDKSWNLAVNGLTFGDDMPYSFGPISNATFHPNKLGHELFKLTLLSQTNNLTEPMPTPDNSISVSDMPSRLNPTGEDLSTTTEPILEDGLFGELIKVGDSIASTISTAGYFLNKGDVFNIELHSTPRVIGSAVATGTDSLDINATIPEGVEPGPHEVHIYGRNIAGEPIDIYKNVLIVAGDIDYDGDGVANSQDNCNFVSPSGVDSDKDGIDDSCDSEILEAPPVVEPPTVEDDTKVPIGVPEDQIVEDNLDDSNRIPEGSGVNEAVAEIIALQATSPEVQNTPVINTDSNQIKGTTASNAPVKVKSVGSEEKKGLNRQRSTNETNKSWYKTALIFLTGTPFGIAIVLLLDL
ncbi:SGNH/GDSL hydrolase family protein [Candidatus Nomurabacteria bacterium]|nr:SGNH/GDSL hydrolase family protein [Candidatus Nomurabacteria bacterium]